MVKPERTHPTMAFYSEPGKQLLARRSRRRLLGLVGAAAGLAVAARPARSAIVAPAGAEEAAPPDRGTGVYVPQTGHNISGPILDHWARYGAQNTFGWPVSEPRLRGPQTTQFFEYGALIADPAVPEFTKVRSLAAGSDWLNRRGQELSSLNRDFAAADLPWGTNVGMHPGFYAWHRDSGGVFAWGNPVDWAYRLDESTILQPFEKAVAVASSGQAPQPLPIGRYLAVAHGFATSAVAPRKGARLYDPADFRPSLGPAAGRWVDVDLTAQLVTLHSADGPAFQYTTSSGKDSFETPPGTFVVNRKVESERMAGFWGTQEFYDISNVYNTIYFTWQGHAFHYAYWHDDFGTRRSHGCLNARLSDSAHTFDFCQVGTRIEIHY